MASTAAAQAAEPPLFAKDSLVVLKGTDPAVVVEAGPDKLEVLLLNKKTKKVRAKDAEAVHPGPVRSWELEELRQERPADPRRVEAAFEALAGSGDATTVHGLAALVFGEPTPAAAWAAWRVVREDLYFHGRPAEVYAYSRARVNEVCAPRGPRAHRPRAAARGVASETRQGHGESRRRSRCRSRVTV